MRNRLNNTYKITYMQLTQTLTALGFTRKDAENLIVFRDVKHDAIIALPIMDNNASVSDPHLVGISNTVTGKGIATKEEFLSLLRRQHKTPSGEVAFLASDNSATKNSAKVRKKLRAAGRRGILTLPDKTE